MPSPRPPRPTPTPTSRHAVQPPGKPSAKPNVKPNVKPESTAASKSVAKDTPPAPTRVAAPAAPSTAGTGDGAPRRFLVKTEPSELSYATLAKDRRVTWDGVRNALAQRHLASMRKGDLVLVYHTGGEKAVVGLARVASAPAPDATDPAGKALAVDLVPVAAAASPVALDAIKADARFANLALVRMPRLSVMPVEEPAWQALVAAAGLPAAP